jgi:hypothetical protein
VSEEGGDGEDVVSGESSLISYTLRYVSLVELGTLCRVGLREPMHLCAFVSEEGGDGEDTGSGEPSLLLYTLRYVSLEEIQENYRSASWSNTTPLKCVLLPLKINVGQSNRPYDLKKHKLV